MAGAPSGHLHAEKQTKLDLRSLLRRPMVIPGLLIVILLVIGDIASPGFASPGQIIKLLTLAALLGIDETRIRLESVASGQGPDFANQVLGFVQALSEQGWEKR